MLVVDAHVPGPTALTNLRFSSETAPPELWLTWNPSSNDTDSASLIL
jgi:hypothetical protein